MRCAILGKNPKRKPVVKYNGFIGVKEVVDTFQGEGPFVGHPAVFVRLGGCNLSCEFCDTFFEDYEDMPVESLVDEIEKKATLQGAKKNLVVITGGEPLRQPIEDLCSKLIDRGFIVQIETNGTIYRDLRKEVSIVCSPKVADGKYLKVEPRLHERVTALKFLISSNKKEYSDIPQKYLNEKSIPIYLQPMDELDELLNRNNRALTIKLANKYGFRLCLQTHKIWNIY